ncbi:DUF6701 domain-containing protein [Saccharospirillum sp.]|uniref:DUF6701 domain-containing protein n=1 Tax=Saccharospirillum sp. TaxID=2033801 RepID=UPI0034A069C1
MTALRKIIHFIIKGLLVSSLLLTGYSFAETYTLPEDGNTGLFSSCSVSGGNIDCAGSITLSDNDFDEIVLTEAINLSIGGNLTVGTNAELNPANNFFFDIIVGGDVSIGNNSLINANLTAGGNINIGNNSDANGDCTANGGNYESYCTAALPSTFAEYRFDQPDWSGQTGEALDSSGNDRHGTPAGFSQTVDPGQICNAGRLNGSIDYITVEDLSVLQGTSSLSFWIRTTNTGNDIGWQAPAIAGVEQSGVADDIFWGWIDASGHIGITKGNDFDATKSDTAINDGTFRHVVLTRDASDGSYQIFIDGIRDRNGTNNSLIGEVGSSFNDIGRVLYSNGSGANFLQADLDEVVIFDDVLDENQVDKLYQRQLEQRNLDGTLRDCPTVATPLGMVGFWELDQPQWSGSTGEVLDSSGNDLHGTTQSGANTSNSDPALSGNPGTCEYGEFNNRSRVETPGSSLITDEQSFSLSLWFKLQGSEQAGSLQTLAAYGGSTRSNEGRFEVYRSGNRLFLEVRLRNGDTRSVDLNNGTLFNGNWQHLTATYNGDSRTLQLHINGTLAETENFGGGQPLNTVAGGLIFGSAEDGSYGINGNIDEVRLFNRVLTAAEIDTAYNYRKPCAPTCFSDDFDSGTLSDDWVTSAANGSFTPGIVNVSGTNRLRMTEAQNNQSTAVTLQRFIPAADNLIVLEFDYYAYDGNGADGLTIVLSDAAITPQTGSFGGSLGYAQRDNGDPGFAGGWLGIGLDEYGDFANPTEGRIGGPGRTLNSVTIRGSGAGGTGYRYLTGTGVLSPGIDSTTSTDPHKYRIIVDSRPAGSSTISVERDIGGTGNAYTTLIGPFDVLSDINQAAVPDNVLLSLTSSTSGSNNIHEFGNFQICADQLNPVGDQLDHFEFIHSGNGITCQLEDIIVQACLDADCDSLYTDEVTANLTPTGWVGGDAVTFSGGSLTVPFQSTSAGTVILGVASSTPTTRPFTETECISGGAGPDPSLCNLTFYDSGLAFSLPDQLANKPSENIRIAAVDTDTETLQCVPAFAGVSRDVQFWSGYVDPDNTGRPVSWPLSVNSREVGQDEASATSLSLDFDSNGEALIDVHYADAGLMQLDARYQGSAANEDEGLVMPGSDIFVSYPAGFVVTPANGCGTADSSCSNTEVAGTDFGITVTAKAWQSDGDADFADNEPTPNFQLSNLALAHTLRAPASGETGTVSLTSYNHLAASDGQNELTQRLSEIGIFDFTLTPPAYFSIDLGTTLSSLSARMIPADFELVQTPGAFNPSCDLTTPMAYSGQTLGWLTRPELQISAVNAEGTLTQNYTQGGFNKLQASDLTRVAPTSDNAALNAQGLPFPLTLTLNAGELDVVNPGIQRYRFSASDSLLYTKTTVSRVAPFMPQVPINLSSLTDDDAVSASALPANLTPTANFDIRYGRIRLENSYGPETRDLIVPMRAEYYDGSMMVLHEAESCWVYSNTDATLSPAITTLEPVNDTLLTGEVKSGSELALIAPGAGNTGSARLTMNVPLWLQDDFNGDGVLSSPEATVTFGVYRGHDRIIYWREVEP